MKWTDELLKKREVTSLKRYGKNNYVETEEFHKKSKQTQINNYGSVKNAYKAREAASRITKLKRYGNSTYHNVEQFKETLLKKHNDFEKQNNCIHYKKIIEQYGQGWLALKLPIIYRGRYRYISNEYLQTIKDYTGVNHNVKAVSKLERELRKFIKSHTNCKLQYNIMNLIIDDQQKYEIDIYIPELKLAFEFNGTYWHSTRFKDKYYHQQKTKLCYENGIQLVHIYEDNWRNNKGIVKQNIINLLNNEDCSYCNWVKLSDYNQYILSEPNFHECKYGKRKFGVYDEGTFIKK